jgi:glutamate carboxypeptidase
VNADMTSTVPPEQILDYFRQQRDAFVDYVKRMIRMESPSVVPRQVMHVLRMVEKSLFETGYGRARGRPAQVMIGHCDTVWPMGTIKEMPVRVDNTRLCGPGVYDMKGGIAQIVFVVRALRDFGVTPNLTPVGLITSDEETGSVESRKMIERIARRCERVYILEPALGLTGRLKTRRKGTGHFEITVRGRASHAGLAPEEGASAILELSHVIQRLFKLNDPERGTTVNVGTIAGGLRANVVAPESRATVDVRITSSEDAKRIEEAIYGLTPAIPGVAIDVEGCVDRSPLDATPRNRVLWELAKSLGQQIGLDLQEGMSGGASDGNFTSQFTATLDGLGPVGDGAHAQREYIKIDETLERCALLTLMLLAPSVREATR